MTGDMVTSRELAAMEQRALAAEAETANRVAEIAVWAEYDKANGKEIRRLEIERSRLRALLGDVLTMYADRMPAAWLAAARAALTPGTDHE